MNLVVILFGILVSQALVLPEAGYIYDDPRLLVDDWYRSRSYSANAQLPVAWDKQKTYRNSGIKATGLFYFLIIYARFTWKTQCMTSKCWNVSLHVRQCMTSKCWNASLHARHSVWHQSVGMHLYMQDSVWHQSVGMHLYMQDTVYDIKVLEFKWSDSQIRTSTFISCSDIHYRLKCCFFIIHNWYGLYFAKVLSVTILISPPFAGWLALSNVFAIFHFPIRSQR